MRIGIDARLPAYRMGGISRYIIQLVNALAAISGPEEYVVFESHKAIASRFPHLPPGSVRRLWTPSHHRLERLALSVELTPHRLDLFHSPDFIPPQRGARRHVITVHDLNFLHYPQFLTEESKRYYAGQVEWAVGHSDHIIADSEHTRQDLIALLSVEPSRVTTVHLAADPLFAQAAEKSTPEAIDHTLRKYALAEGFILFVGTVEPRKNLPHLLDAYQLARQSHGLAAPLLIVGQKGWLYQSLFQKIDALGLHGVVRHIDSATDLELAHLYLAASLLALPSHYEGFGLPVLEAMHCRCPVIASNRASLPEVVGEAGILLSPDDVASWAREMAQLAADGAKRSRLAELGLAQAQRFTWHETATQTRSVYERLG